jgi:hypothetical protein
MNAVKSYDSFTATSFSDKMLLDKAYEINKELDKEEKCNV